MKRIWTVITRRYGTSKHEWESMEIYDYGWLKKPKRTAVYGFGLSAAGELGFRLDQRNGLMKPRRLAPLRLVEIDKHQVSDLACGRGFSVFVTRSSTRSVLGCGLNVDCQLGLQSRMDPPWVPNPKPLPIQFPNGTKPIRVGCGRQHTLVITNKSEAYALGNNSHGQCGRPIIEDEEYGKAGVIYKINVFDGRIIQVACGLDHNVLLTDRGSVYTFGCGTDGQLGNESYASNWKPTLVAGDIKGEKIVQISTSADCVLAVSESGDLFGWGNNEYKQLQSATTEIQSSIPRKLKLGIGKIRHAAAGGSACAAVTESGKLYVWGYGVIGQGPDITTRSEPSILPPPLFGATQFEPDVKVKAIYAGLMNFAAINSKGELFSWGVNRHGELGLGHENYQYFPYKVPIAFDVIKVSCGPDHTLVLCKAWS